MCRFFPLLVACLSYLASCAAPPVSTPAEPSAVEPNDPVMDEVQASQASAIPGPGTADCTDHWPTDVPNWPIEPGAAVPDVVELTGNWVLVQENVPGVTLPPVTAGPVAQALRCYGGYEILMLRRDGDRVVARWAYKEQASGALRNEWSVDAERLEGTLKGDLMTLRGAHVRESGSRDQPDSNMLCTPVTYELRVDAAMGHWVGHRNRQKVRLAPLELHPLPSPCGKPPS